VSETSHGGWREDADYPRSCDPPTDGLGPNSGKTTGSTFTMGENRGNTGVRMGARSLKQDYREAGNIQTAWGPVPKKLEIGGGGDQRQGPNYPKKKNRSRAEGGGAGVKNDHRSMLQLKRGGNFPYKKHTPPGNFFRRDTGGGDTQGSIKKKNRGSGCTWLEHKFRGGGGVKG